MVLYHSSSISLLNDKAWTINNILSPTLIMYIRKCLQMHAAILCAVTLNLVIYFMHCNLTESVGSWEQWLWDTARRNVFLLFSIILRILQCYIITLEPLVWFRWGFQQSTSLLLSNRKLKMSHIGLQTDFRISHHILCSDCILLLVCNIFLGFSCHYPFL